jgi:hypothetical protein
MSSYSSLSGMMLKSSTVCGRKCSTENCAVPASFICKACVLKPGFCEDHALAHHNLLKHAMLKKGGEFLNGEKKSLKKILLITLNGWWYDSREKDSIFGEEVWFPLTPSRPTTFVHVDLMKLASAFMADGMISAENVMNCLEKYFERPPPKQWRNSFAEALRVFMCFQTYLKYGKTDVDLSSGNTKCGFKCPSCFSPAASSGTIIMVKCFF